MGRRGGKRDLIPLAKRMRREPTEAEARLWSILRAGRMDGAKFKRQEQIGDYIVDFVCFAERLIVEADGSQHVENGADQVRDAWLKSQDFRILRFWNDDILRDTDAVGEAIHAALRPPLPNPLPQGESAYEHCPTRGVPCDTHPHDPHPFPAPDRRNSRPRAPQIFFAWTV
ncbi:MAG: DUF559 domain-containing protein [Pseudomonadota bacterium]|nr:DUF559 domain-containing protein [Pseudomonadota bacterium]